MNQEAFYSIFFRNHCKNRTVLYGDVHWDISCADAKGFISTNLKMNAPVFLAGLINARAQCFKHAGDESPDKEVTIRINVAGLFH